MVKKIVNEFIALLDNQRSFLKNVESLKDDQINWIPNGSKNSIGILLEHLTGAEKMLIHQMIFGITIQRDRDKEFEKRARNILDLINEYQKTANETKKLLSSMLNDEQLLELKERRGEKKTIFWALSHTLEHNYYHIGQINLLIALIGQLKEH